MEFCQRVVSNDTNKTKLFICFKKISFALSSLLLGGCCKSWLVIKTPLT